MKQNQVVLQSIKALKLAPTDTLVLHFDKQPTDEQRRELDAMVKSQLWGTGIKFMCIWGHFNPAKVPTDQL